MKSFSYGSHKYVLCSSHACSSISTHINTLLKWKEILDGDIPVG